MVLHNIRVGTKELIISLAVSIVYGALSLLFDPDLNLIFESPINQGRPLIFILALVSIFYGPVIGGLSAGIGNLLYDIMRGPVLSGGTLDLNDWVGFFANISAGVVTGIIGKAFTSADTLLDFDDNKPDHFYQIFKFSFFRTLMRNLIAATFGYGIVLGAILGYGFRLVPGFTGNSFDIYLSIAYSNGVYLLAITPIAYILVAILDYIGDRNAAVQKEKSRQIIINNTSEKCTIKGVCPLGDELFNDDWGAVELEVFNSSERPRKYSVRISSNDIFTPHRHITPTLQPGTSDKMYFNVYSLSPGEKVGKLFVTENKVEEEMEIRYKVNATGVLLAQKIMGLFLILGLVVTTYTIAIELKQEATLSTPVQLALIAVPIEFILLYIYHRIRNTSLVSGVVDAMTNPFANKGEEFLVGIDTDKVDPELEIKSLRKKSWFFLSIGGTTLLALWGIIYAIENDLFDIGDNGWTLAVIAAVITVLLVFSQNYLEKADRLQKSLDDALGRSKKNITFALAESSFVARKTTPMKVRIRNKFENKGLRVFIHSIDHVTPKELLLDINPNEEREVQLDVTPIDEGKREISFEFLPYRDLEGKIIDQEEADTIDQESLEFKAYSASILGISPGQISLLKKVIAGAGATSIAFGTVSEILGIRVSARTLNATLPLILLLQAPVIWTALYFQNRSAKKFESID